MYEDNKGWVNVSLHEHKMPDDNTYKNTSNPRGVVFVFNNLFVKPNQHLGREGAKKDSENLNGLFHKMGYEVFVYEDYTYNETFEKLCLIQQNKEVDLNNFDSFIVFLLSHGQNDNFVSVDDRQISLDNVMSMFKNNNCKFLQDKPKCYFVNFCRGYKLEADGGLENDERVKENGLTTAFPFKDTCIFFACQKDIKALRDPSEGTIFIQSVYEVLSKKAHKKHIEDLWKDILRLMKEKSGTTGEYINRGFFKQFYFNPVCQRLQINDAEDN